LTSVNTGVPTARRPLNGKAVAPPTARRRKPLSPPANADREWLKQSLADHRRAITAITKQKGAILKMAAAKSAAAKAAAAAENEISAALDARASIIATTAAAGEDAPATSAVPLARARHQSMSDESDALAAALGKLREGLPALERAELIARKQLEAAVCELCSSPAEKILAEALKLKEQLDPLIGALASLFASDVGMLAGEYGRTDVRGDRLDRVRKTMMALYRKPPDGLGGEPWNSIRRRLLEDEPDAPIDALLEAARNADAAARS
jgi:hypothetical protein